MARVGTQCLHNTSASSRQAIGLAAKPCCVWVANPDVTLTRVMSILPISRAHQVFSEFANLFPRLMAGCSIYLKIKPENKMVSIVAAIMLNAR